MKEIWDHIYGNNNQLNKHPYTTVVSFLMGIKNKNPDKKFKILEVGCGAGNNILFAQKEGFETYGIDISEHAIKFAKNAFEKEGLPHNLFVQSFPDLNFDDNYFDIVIDRAATSSVDYNLKLKLFKQINRVLKKDGVFYFETYSDKSDFNGELVSKNYYKLNEGQFSNLGYLSFYSKNDIIDLMNKEMNLISLEENVSTSIIGDNYNYALFYGKCIKK